MKIGEKLSELRKTLGKTQKEVANALGVGMATLGHWENNRNEPSFDDIENICKYYSISISELFGQSSPEQPLDNDIRNSLVEDIIDMLIDEGTLSNVSSFDELDADSQQMIICAVNKTIKKKSK